VINGLSIGLGYLKGLLIREARLNDPEFVAFIRKDQLARIRRMLLPWKRLSSPHGKTRFKPNYSYSC
jgi:hypothetical protein